MKFIEHGIFEVRTEEQLLLVDATGPFNEELIISYQKSLESCIQSLQETEWNQIITLHCMSVFTPKAADALTETLINRKSRGLQRSAVVYGDVDCKVMLVEQIGRCYKKAEVGYQFFNTLEKAQEWIKSI